MTPIHKDFTEQQEYQVQAWKNPKLTPFMWNGSYVEFDLWKLQGQGAQKSKGEEK